jgi:hypothetical protein
LGRKLIGAQRRQGAKDAKRTGEDIFLRHIVNFFTTGFLLCDLCSFASWRAKIACGILAECGYAGVE